jgi:AcrR family transcriptional regulator
METTTSKTNRKSAAGRPREFNEAAVLDRAIAAFSRYGYAGSSISSLADALDLTQGSIYKAFGDKHGLLTAALDRYIELRSRILETKLAAARTGRERVAAVLDAYAQYSHGEVGRTGCLVVGSLVEFALSDPELNERVSLIMASHEARLLRFIREGQLDGSINDRIDADATARALLCLAQGMRVLGKTNRREDEISAIPPIAMHLLD